MNHLERPIEPTEQGGNLVEKGFQRRQRRQLVAEHVRPLRLEFLDMGSGTDSCRSWDRDRLCSAFLFENRTYEIAMQAKVVPAEQVHDVIEIAWSSSLPHGSDLFSEDL